MQFLSFCFLTEKQLLVQVVPIPSNKAKIINSDL